MASSVYTNNNNIVTIYVRTIDMMLQVREFDKLLTELLLTQTLLLTAHEKS